VSKDPITGANQSRSSFWGKVHAYFEEHKKTTAPRTVADNSIHAMRPFFVGIKVG